MTDTERDLRIRSQAHADAAGTARFKAREALQDGHNAALAALFERLAGTHEAIAEHPGRIEEIRPQLRELIELIDAEQARMVRASSARIGA